MVRLRNRYGEEIKPEMIGRQGRVALYRSVAWDGEAIIGLTLTQIAQPIAWFTEMRMPHGIECDVRAK